MAIQLSLVAGNLLVSFMSQTRGNIPGRIIEKVELVFWRN